MRKINILIIRASIFLLPVILIGCGSNVFEGLAQKPEQNLTLQDKMDTASTTEEFKEIAADATTVIQNTEEGSDEWKNANRMLGKAILGQHDVTAIDVVKNLLDSNKEDSSVTNVYDVIEDTLVKQGERVASTDLKLAANALNNGTDSNSSTSSQLIRGMANALVIIDMVTLVYDVSDDGVEPKDSNLSSIKQLDALMDPDGNGVTSDSFIIYTNAAEESLNASNALPDDEREDIDRLIENADKVNNLYTALKKDGESFEYEKNASPYTITSADIDDDTKTEDAIDWIFSTN